jgi:hypothetical protein
MGYSTRLLHCCTRRTGGLSARMWNSGPRRPEQPLLTWITVSLFTAAIR